MLRLTVLNCIAPKLRPNTEPLDAHARNWFTDGYRVSAPSTNTCRQDSDCEGSEICQAGYCAGIHRKYSTHGLYYGNEYKNLAGLESNALSYLEHGNYYRPHDFFYEYAFEQDTDIDGINIVKSTAPIHRRVTDSIDYDYTY